MQAIYTRTMRVKDDSLGKAMEIGKGLAKVRKKIFPKAWYLFFISNWWRPQNNQRDSYWFYV